MPRGFAPGRRRGCRRCRTLRPRGRSCFPPLRRLARRDGADLRHVEGPRAEQEIRLRSLGVGKSASAGLKNGRRAPQVRPARPRDNRHDGTTTRPDRSQGPAGLRTTPASAGLIPAPRATSGSTQVHPRWRGAEVAGGEARPQRLGSIPVPGGAPRRDRFTHRPWAGAIYPGGRGAHLLLASAEAARGRGMHRAARRPG